MNKTMTMQEILNNKELLNILSTFREEEEIKEFCKENSIEVSQTVLFNLKKTLENQAETIKKANVPLTTQTLNAIAGGDDTDKKRLSSGDYGVDTSYEHNSGMDTAGIIQMVTGTAMNIGFLGFGIHGVIQFRNGLKAGSTSAKIPVELQDFGNQS